MPAMQSRSHARGVPLGSIFAVAVLVPAVALLAVACVVTATATPGSYGQLEYNMNRSGSDYRDFDLQEARPDLCLAACNAEPQCLAFTYVNPGVQGPAPRCWLKSAIPDATPNNCCVSGVVRGGAPPAPAPAPEAQAPPPPPAPAPMPPPPPPVRAGGRFERNINRGGSDYRDFDLAAPRPELCLEACEREGQCLAYTYVRPGVQGPAPRCWLKSAIPQPTPNDCCVSGVVRTAPVMMQPPLPPPPPPPRGGAALERNINRPGADYRSFDLAQPAPHQCQAACFAEPQCVAFTFVHPGVQGPNARCWLKSAVPPPVPDRCCVSGLK
jgi:hypothetical protein